MHVRLARSHELTETAYTDPARDVVFVAVSNGAVLGQICVRPMYYTHSFVLPDDPIRSRPIADALFHHIEGFTAHARNFARPGEWAGYGTLFHVHNQNGSMKRFIESKGALAEPDALVYRIDIP